MGKILKNDVEILFRPDKTDRFKMYVESYEEYKIHRMVVMKVGDFNKTDFVMIKVVVVPKISLWKKKFFYDFKTGNYIISRVICKERHSF